MDDDDWMRCSVEEDQESERILEALRNEFDEQLDIGDTTMVAEYSEEIFEYMADLEVRFLIIFFRLVVVVAHFCDHVNSDLYFRSAGTSYAKSKIYG